MCDVRCRSSRSVRSGMLIDYCPNGLFHQSDDATRVDNRRDQTHCARRVHVYANSITHVTNISDDCDEPNLNYVRLYAIDVRHADDAAQTIDSSQRAHQTSHTNTEFQKAFCGN